jgi:hypothetical protein
MNLTAELFPIGNLYNVVIEGSRDPETELARTDGPITPNATHIAATSRNAVTTLLPQAATMLRTIGPMISGKSLRRRKRARATPSPITSPARTASQATNEEERKSKRQR